MEETSSDVVLQDSLPRSTGHKRRLALTLAGLISRVLCVFEEMGKRSSERLWVVSGLFIPQFFREWFSENITKRVSDPCFRFSKILKTENGFRKCKQMGPNSFFSLHLSPLIFSCHFPLLSQPRFAKFRNVSIYILQSTFSLVWRNLGSLIRACNHVVAFFKWIRRLRQFSYEAILHLCSHPSMCKHIPWNNPLLLIHLV